MGKQVKMLGMFDTNAEESTLHYSLTDKLSRKAARQLPKLAWVVQSLIEKPIATLRYQQQYVEGQIKSLLKVTGNPTSESKADAGPDHMDRIIEKHEIAYQNYRLKPYDGTVDLFKAQIRHYFVDDRKYLGWKKYALKGVRVHDVPGDHGQMLQPPNDRYFAQALQWALDNDA
jgi:thioesterase domain-containing protein